jgi:hypothetical protein
MAASPDPEARIGTLYLDVLNLNPPDPHKLRTVRMAATESAGLNEVRTAGAIAARCGPNPSFRAWTASLASRR